MSLLRFFSLTSSLLIAFTVGIFGQQPGTPEVNRQVIRPEAGSANADQMDAILRELREIRRLLERQQPQQAQSACTSPSQVPAPDKVKLTMGTAGQSLGKVDAPVTVVEFTDLQCPYCQRFHREMFPRLQREYIDSGKVRFVSRDLPLAVHPYAMKASEAVRCAGEEKRAWDLRNAILSSSLPPSDDVLVDLAGTLGLDTSRFRDCVKSEKYKSLIQKDVDEANAIQIRSTPTFLIGATSPDSLDGMRVLGAGSYSVIQGRIEDILRLQPARTAEKSSTQLMAK